MNIMEFETAEPYQGLIAFQPLGSPIPNEKHDIEIQCAASWKNAQELGIQWSDCPWKELNDSIEFQKIGFSALSQGGWQEYGATRHNMKSAETPKWIQTILPSHRIGERQAECRLSSPLHAQGSHPPPTQAIRTTAKEDTHRPKKRPKKQTTLAAPAPLTPDEGRGSDALPVAAPAPPKSARVRPKTHSQEWQAAEHEESTDTMNVSVGQAIDKLQQVCGHAPYVGRPLQVISMNMRSSADMLKVHHLTYRLQDIPENTDIVVVLQETWLQSEQARSAIRPVCVSPGWQAAALDRSLPEEPKSGGVMTLLRAGRVAADRNNDLTVRHDIIDSEGALGTYVHRARKETGRRDATETTAILNVYVPTGRNRLKQEREQQLTERVLGAARHAGENNARVIIAGDWNHLTQEWSHHLRALGFTTAAQEGVEIMMVKSQQRTLKSCVCHEVCEATSELFTDHPLLSIVLPQAQMIDSHDIDVKINTDLVTAHGEEFRDRLMTAYSAHQATLQQLTVTDRLRWAETQLARAGHEIHLITTTYTLHQGAKVMHYPKRIQKLHDKLRGKIPLGVGETVTQLRKRVRRAVDRWHSRQFERLLARRDARYDCDMKRTFRQLTALPRESMQVLVEADRAVQHNTAEQRDECARRRIGSLWSTRPDTDLDAIPTSPAWLAFTQAEPQNDLTGIDRQVTDTEINTAFQKMGTGKATQSDHISKEILQQVPPEYMTMFTDYVKHTLRTGHVEEEEGLTDVVLLTKKPNLSAQEITNKRPISLIKFVTKWVQTILAHRIQARLQHLENYGFQKTEKHSGGSAQDHRDPRKCKASRHPRPHAHH